MPGGQNLDNTDPLQTGPVVVDPVLGYDVSAEFHSVNENDFPVDNVGEPQVADADGVQRNLTNAEILAGEQP